MRESDRLRSEFTLFTQGYRDLTKLKNRANELYKGPFFLRCLHSSHDADVLKELRMNVTKIIEYFKVGTTVTFGIYL